MVICLERGADLHMAQLMQLPLTVSCFSKIQIGFTFLVPADPGSPGKMTVKRVCVCCKTCLLILEMNFIIHEAEFYWSYVSVLETDRIFNASNLENGH